MAFAPIQGYTNAPYRMAHHLFAGGVDEYYTPFVRIEKGEIRRKDLRDTDPKNCEGVNTVPQVIARDVEEFAFICDALQNQGWKRIDLNLGCPFPMQVNSGRGCGLLQKPDKLEATAIEMKRRSDVIFSVKMRTGQDNIEEGMQIMPIINDMPLIHLVLHPRLGRQQYKGSADMEAFLRFAEACQHPMVYNGDITDIRKFDSISAKIKGLMIGRGLLAKPWMLCEKEPMTVLNEMHSFIYRHATENLCGETQILSFLHAFWEYIEIDRKAKKEIMKSKSLARYREAVKSVI